MMNFSAMNWNSVKKIPLNSQLMRNHEVKDVEGEWSREVKRRVDIEFTEKPSV